MPQDQQEQYYAEALEICAYNAMALRAMCLWAHEHLKDKAAMKAASAAWGRNARNFGKAVEYFAPSLCSSGSDALSADEILSYVAMAALPIETATDLFHEMYDKTLSYWQVRERVQELRGRRERKPSLAYRCAGLVREFEDAAMGMNPFTGDAFMGCAKRLREQPEVKKCLEAKNG